MTTMINRNIENIFILHNEENWKVMLFNPLSFGGEG